MKQIRVDFDKCIGCGHCELACSLQHIEDKVNPSLSRIRIYLDTENDVYIPIVAGPYTDAKCSCRYTVVMGGQEYEDCILCRAACPQREIFFDDYEVPLKCDLCGEPPDPSCVKWCPTDALTVMEVEEENEEAASQ